MAEEAWAKLLGGWDGFELVKVEEHPVGPGQPIPEIVLHLRSVPGYKKRCSRCGEPVVEIHDVTERRVRDLSVFDWETWIVFPRARLSCSRCGPTVEAVPWLDRYQRMTTRLAEKIARLSMVLPIRHVAAWFHVHWSTVKQIDHRSLYARLGPITRESLSDVRLLVIDEFAIQKGHRYATVIVDPETKRVLWVHRGRDRAAIRPFFELLGPEGRARIEAVAVDMSGSYSEEIGMQCPRAALVYDLFHVVAKYAREVIDRVRVDETNKIAQAAGPTRSHKRALRSARRVIKGTRWLLLKNRDNISSEERVRLDELLQANKALFIVYVLKDDLKRLWQYRCRKAALQFWEGWYERAMASGISALIRFAHHLTPYIPGILNHCRYRLHTGLVEGINNKIKVIKRMAYGYRDDAYFFLKIRAAFPGIP